MNPKNLITIAVLLTTSLLFSACASSVQTPTTQTRISDQRDQAKYGRTPEEYQPYGKFSEPYKKFFLEPNEYRGHGRNIPEPEKVESVKIGFIGPLEQTVSVATGGISHEEELGKKMLMGARMAIEQANERGGYRGEIPFELVVRNDNGLWGASGSEVIHLAYNEKVRAILGTIDGANSHIAIRAALKIEIPVMNTGDTDPTFIETAIPWVFRCITDDRQMCYLLADFVFKKLKLTRVAVLRANNRYGRIGIDEFRDAATRLGHPLMAELNYQVGDTDFTAQLARLQALDPEAIVTYGDAEESGLILKQMRERGMDQWFIGSDRIVSDTFLNTAGKNPGKVAAAYPYNPDSTDPAYVEFRMQFEKRFGQEPEVFASHAYDGMNMLIQAIERAGLNRAKIRDALAEMKNYSGVTGEKQFDAIFNNIAEPYMAVLEDGRFKFHSWHENYKRMLDDPMTFSGKSAWHDTTCESSLISIGLFAPSAKSDPVGRDLENGAILALEQANKQAGNEDKRYNLVRRWADSPWGAGSREMTRMAYEDRVCAIIGYLDGASNIAQQVAVKAWLPVLAPIASDSSLTHARVPWIFRLPPNDRRQADKLVKEAVNNGGFEKIGIITDVGHDGRVFWKNIRRAMADHGLFPVFHLPVSVNESKTLTIAERVGEFKVDTLFVRLPPSFFSRLIADFNARKIRMPLYIPWIPGLDTEQTADIYHGSLVALTPFAPEGSNYESFAKAYKNRFGIDPSASAAYAHDAARLIIHAIENTEHSNRTAIRDSLAALKNFQGVTGLIQWDNGGGNRALPVGHR